MASTTLEPGSIVAVTRLHLYGVCGQHPGARGLSQGNMHRRRLEALGSGSPYRAELKLVRSIVYEIQVDEG